MTRCCLRLRQAAAVEGGTLSSRTERAVRAELTQIAAPIAAEWERATGDPQARAFAKLAEQQAISEAIRSSDPVWSSASEA